MNVLVYAGEGVSSQSLRHTMHSLGKAIGGRYDIKTVDDRILSDHPWEHQCAALVMPGGRDLPYLSRLEGRACGRISAWVGEAGGRYLGICAGAYFGSAMVDFEPGTGMAVTGERPLRFFPVKACGTLYPGTYVYDSEAGAKAIPVSFTSLSSFYAYYNGGCWFESLQDGSFSILGTYPDGRAAIIGGAYGKGKVVLSGVHPEYDPTVDCSDIPGEIVQSILATDPQRWAAWKQLLGDHLGLDVSTPSALPPINQYNGDEVTVFAPPGSPILQERLVFEGEGAIFTSDYPLPPPHSPLAKKTVVHLKLPTSPNPSWTFDPTDLLSRLTTKWMGRTFLYAEQLSSTQTILQEYTVTF